MKQEGDRVIELTEEELRNLEDSCEEIVFLKDGDIRYVFGDNSGTIVLRAAFDAVAAPAAPDSTGIGISCICGVNYCGPPVRTLKCPACGHIWDLTPQAVRLNPALASLGTIIKVRKLTVELPKKS